MLYCITLQYGIVGSSLFDTYCHYCQMPLKNIKNGTTVDQCWVSTQKTDCLRLLVLSD